MVSVYASSVTPRLQYILGFIGKELFDEQVQLFTDKHAFLNVAGFRINYSAEMITDPVDALPVFRVVPVALLFEKDISARHPDVFKFQDSKALYKTDGDFPFDIFAASFYLISRYEEYLPHIKDEYGRYSHKESIAFRENFLNSPVVNIWLSAFQDILRAADPSIKFRHRNFKCTITYDIDIAWSYKNKGLYRTIAGFVKDIINGKWRAVDDRWLVLQKQKQDPYDCFEWLDALHLYCRLKPYYFFLVAKKQVGYDKNISTNVQEFRELVEYYATKYETGIHPSWQSGDNKKLLKEELEWLEVMADKPVKCSRQHYIRFDTPGTFRTLTETGITNDFSMGYGSSNGFRASVCSSYKWYDLLKDEATDLTIHPFCFMDANSYFEQNQNPEQTYKELLEYYETVKRLNGTFISVWHNHMLGTDPIFKGWPGMFELFMKETVYWDAYSDAQASLIT